MDLKDYRQVRGQTKWTTATGENISVKHMKTSHVQNIALLLSRKLKECAELQLGPFLIKGIKAEEWIELFQTEIKFRQDPKSVCSSVMAQVLVEEIVEEVVEVKQVEQVKVML